MQFRYRLIDVFAERAFAGNPVAVFTDARGLETEMMQKIAAELNRTRTSFIFPTDEPDGNPGVRVFSPTRELPCPQYPTIGAAFALELDRGETAAPSQHRVVFDSQEGPVSVSSFARVLTVRHPVPKMGRIYADTEAVMATLGLADDVRLTGAPVQAVAGDVPFLIVPLRGGAALREICFRQDIWSRTVAHFEAPSILAFTLETGSGKSIASMRVFVPDGVVREEPATEEACGPLAAYLVRYGLASAESPQLLSFEQGTELGRPSLLHVAIDRTEVEVTSVRVGGQCVHVGDGVLTPPQQSRR